MRSALHLIVVVLVITATTLLSIDYNVTRLDHEQCFSPKGENGTNGVKGETGPQGDKGPNGTTGAKGLKGPSGIQGMPGLRGTNGSAGLQGSPGPAGSPGANMMIQTYAYVTSGDGGVLTGATWTTVPLNTNLGGNLDGIFTSLDPSTGVFTLEPGSYLLHGSVISYDCTSANVYIWRMDTVAAALPGSGGRVGTTSLVLDIVYSLTLTGARPYALRVAAGTTSGTGGIGLSGTSYFTAANNTYAILSIIRWP